MERGIIYKCVNTGVVIEILECGSVCEACTEQEMQPLLERGAAEEGKEKHVPVVTRSDGRILVTVGSTPHPMEQEHWIQWIELRTGDQVYRKHLRPGERPEATFPVVDGDFTVRELCNKHGLWKA